MDLFFFFFITPTGLWSAELHQRWTVPQARFFTVYFVLIKMHKQLVNQIISKVASQCSVIVLAHRCQGRINFQVIFFFAILKVYALLQHRRKEQVEEKRTCIHNRDFVSSNVTFSCWHMLLLLNNQTFNLCQ